MTTKEKLLALLESGRGVYFSGEELARRLEVSRAAVWKAVSALRSDGYAIDAVTHKGYCLSQNSDVLSEGGIRAHLAPPYRSLQLQVLPEVTSTNALVREAAAVGAPEGYTILAGQQSAGRGRYGRSFFSPEGTGVYFSILLRPAQYTAQQAVRITTMAAAAMCRAIEEVSEEKPQIKWVNDIFIRGKKVCGILTEASFGLESGQLDYAVLGVGVNVYRPAEGFPAELEDIAGAVFPSPRSNAKNRLIAAFINQFMAYYTDVCGTDYIEVYRRYSLALGRRVTVLGAGEPRSALVCGIDDECRLQLRFEDGEEATLSSGEISIRL